MPKVEILMPRHIRQLWQMFGWSLGNRLDGYVSSTVLLQLRVPERTVEMLISKGFVASVGSEEVPERLKTPGRRELFWRVVAIPGVDGSDESVDEGVWRERL